MAAVRGRRVLAALLAAALALFWLDWHRSCAVFVLRRLPLSTHVDMDATPRINAITAASSCLEPPLCAAPHRLTWYGRALCALADLPLPPTSRAYERYATARLRRVGAHHIHGCPAREPVMRLLQQHLHELTTGRPRRRWPLTLHFAGDNGVGKTRMAEVVSLALAQHCGNAACTLGDNTLELSGSSFDGLTVAQFRRILVDVVSRHVRRYPRNGVIIINELSSLDQAKTRVLMPLLGAASAFPERAHDDLSGQIVLVTTDFGREGRTRGKNLTEMRAFIKAEFASMYSAKADAMVHTFPFLPVSLDTAAVIARMAVRDAVCEVYASPLIAHAAQHAHTTDAPAPVLCPVRISDGAVNWLLDSVQLLLPVENGRAVVQAVDAEVQPLLVNHSSHRMLQQQQRTAVYFPDTAIGAEAAAHDTHARHASQGCVVDIDDASGVLALRCNAAC